MTDKERVMPSDSKGPADSEGAAKEGTRPKGKRLFRKVSGKKARERVPEPSPAKPFECVECGAVVPAEADRCPICHVRYIRDISPESANMLDELGEDFEPGIERALEKEHAPVMHFDAENGVIRFLEEAGGDIEFECECSHCGTVIEFDCSRCPVCGAQLESGDSGIVHLFEGMDFDEELPPEADCPNCGDHVPLVAGKCPSCGEQIMVQDPEDPGRKVTPVVKGDNVVFLHLDVETGELSYLQKMHKVGMQSVTVHIGGPGSGSCSDDSDGLSRT